MGLAECHPGNLRPSENLIFFLDGQVGEKEEEELEQVSQLFLALFLTTVSPKCLYLQHSSAVLLFYLCLYLCSICVCICIRFVFLEAKSQGCAGRSTVVCFLGHSAASPQ